eukprot:TRINITY_DN2259_c0_g2_i1.p1 TRINITY_DN2259_c0_g2~~TRINITY_DN2259_c0_g2_i1.p1  ORF type:complete len:470 (-),score=108.66 TRINITY_DN2259_c0_g2_i1:470-1834(-)
MASKLVPINREFLASLYKKYPIEPTAAAVVQCIADCQALSAKLISIFSTSNTPVPQTAPILPSPKKLDENNYRHREQLDLIDEATAPNHFSKLSPCSAAQSSYIEGMKGVQSFALEYAAFFIELEKKRMAVVDDLIRKFLPNDFRLTLINKIRERSAGKARKEIEALNKRGGTIAERYDLLWAQKMRQRDMLVQFGQASGIFKAFLSLVAGVPQVMLDFIKTINDDQGPMEETRATYGPYLYDLTQLIHNLRSLLQLSTLACLLSGLATDVASARDSALLEVQAVAQNAVRVYVESLLYYTKHTDTVLAASPFMLHDYELGTTLTAEPATQITVPRSGEYDVTVSCPIGSTFAFEFSTEKNDIGYQVLCAGQVVKPLARVDAHKVKVTGAVKAEPQHTAPFVLRFNNKYSFLRSKTVFYRTLIIAPTVDDAAVLESLQTDDAALATTAASADDE